MNIKVLSVVLVLIGLILGALVSVISALGYIFFGDAYLLTLTKGVVLFACSSVLFLIGLKVEG